MSENKRRLSNNKGFLGQSAEEEDDDDDNNITHGMSSSGRGGISNRRSLGGRRRSSFGSHSSKSPGSSVEQSRIAEMYRNVIKMSSENKINNKNSWSLDLIDHMGNLIKGDATGARGVNFQKASCTLETSVKIYSCRVDDTHASSQKIIENLSRTLGVDDGGDDNNRRAARVGSKSASSRLNIVNTIASDVDSINASKIERVQATDPMFHKMSKAFDDGGAKGMLMNNLRISSTECSLFFASANLTNVELLSEPLNCDSASSAASASATVEVTGCVDISDMLSRCGFDAASLLSMSICPALSSYREMIGVPESSDGIFDQKEFTTYFPSSRISSSSLTDSFVQQSSVSDSHTSNDDFDYGDDNDDEVGDFGELSLGDYPSALISSARKSAAGIAFNRRSSIGGVGKIQWDSISENNTSEAVHDPATPKGKESFGSNGTGSSNSVVWDAAGITCSNEYSFFDMDLVNKSNSWAGARHWKYATRRQTQTQSAAVEILINNEGDGAEAAPSDLMTKKIPVTGKSIKGHKEKFKFDFLSPFPPEECFVVSKIRSKGGDVTCLTAAALEKEALIQKEGGLFLPPDAKLQTSDLCRLMLSHSIIVPPPMLAHVFIKQAASSSSRKGKNGDVIWGQIRRVNQPNSAFQFQSNMEYDDGDDDDNDGGNFGEDFCDPDMDDVVTTNRDENENNVPETQKDGLYISTEGLLKATRTVDKIDIGFATVSKKVNMKRLKSDIWTQIDELSDRTSLGSHGKNREFSMNSQDQSSDIRDTSGTRVRESLSEGELSFQDLVSDINIGQKQKDVTFAFYFISLLHLANEKTLRIDGSRDMSDLFISKDD